MVVGPRLQISDGLALPIEFMTKTAAILAQRRKGKTYTASVLAEELVAASQPFVALDPTGAWWGLRAAADGVAAGLPVVILGGQHGDLPLEREAGRFIADLVLDNPGYYVLDFSLLGARKAEREFATDFADRLYRRKMQPQMDFPLHLFIDEADLFVPQERDTGDTTMLGAFQSIVRRGGLHGLGSTLISQRPALVNKSVLEMIDMLIILRTVGPNDQKSVRGYVKSNATPEQEAELMGSLSSLGIGEAWVWEPGGDPPLYERVQIRQRRTFNSSQTPKVGETRVEPRRLADVDLATIKDQMADMIERAAEEDPKALKTQLAKLRKDVKDRDGQIAELRELERSFREQPVPAEPEIEYVDRPVLTDEHLEALDRFVEVVAPALNDSTKVMTEMCTEIGALRRDRQDLLRAKDPVRPAEAGRGRAGDGARARVVEARQPAQRPRPTARRDSGGDAVPGDASLPDGERRVLIAIAQHIDGVTREQATILTGYKRSTRDAYIHRLSHRGLVVVSGGGLVSATDDGIAALGDEFEPLPTGDALRRYWLERLPEGEARVLGRLVRAYPRSVSREKLSEDTGYKRSTRDAYISRLRVRQLVTTDGEPRAVDGLFDE